MLTVQIERQDEQLRGELRFVEGELPGVDDCGEDHDLVLEVLSEPRVVVDLPGAELVDGGVERMTNPRTQEGFMQAAMALPLEAGWIVLWETLQGEP